MESSCKRSRSSNYSRDEIAHLLNLVGKYKNILENKQTDGVTWRKKDETWKKLTVEFNANSPAGIYRPMESLKKCYDNKKKEARKAAANEQNSCRRTGGGPPEHHLQDPLKEMTVSLMNKKTVYGLDNPYDCDNNVLRKQHSKYTLSEDSDSNAEQESEVITLEVADEDAMPAVAQEKEQEEINKEFSEASTSQQLQTQLPASLKKRIKRNTQNNSMGATWTSRRRPVVTALSSSHIAKEYTVLANNKIELVSLQKEILQKDKELKDLQIEKVKLEIALLKQQLLPL